MNGEDSEGNVIWKSGQVETEETTEGYPFVLKPNEEGKLEITQFVILIREVVEGEEPAPVQPTAEGEEAQGPEGEIKIVESFDEDFNPVYRYIEPIDYEELARDEEQAKRFAELEELEANDPEQERKDKEEADFQAVQLRTNEQVDAKLLGKSSKNRYLAFKNSNVCKTLSDIWDLFKKTFHVNIHKDEFVHFMAMVHRLFAPQLSNDDAKNCVLAAIEYNVETVNDEISEYDFNNIVIDFLDLILEHSDPGNYHLVLKAIYDKLTRVYVRKIQGACVEIPSYMEVTFFDNEFINQSLTRDNTVTDQPKNVLYVEEKRIYNRDAKLGNFDCAEERILLENIDDVVPIGFETQNCVDNFKNSQNFSSNVKVINADFLQKFTEADEELFYLGFILINHPGEALCRLNVGLFKPFFYEKLRDKTGNDMYFNTKSIFALNCNIDEIYKLNKHWIKPLKDDSELNALKLITKNPKSITQVLLQNKFQYFRENEKILKKLGTYCNVLSLDSYAEITSEKLEDFRSGDPELPIDNALPDEDDLIEWSKKRPIQIQLHGKPKIGKTKIAKELSKQLGLELIDFETFLTKFLERAKEGEENVEVDDDGNPIEFQNAMERDILLNLRNGQRVSTDNMMALMVQEIAKQQLDLKGFVFELPTYQNPADTLNFQDLIKSNKFNFSNQKMPFNYIINLEVSDEEVFNRTKKILENNDPENFSLTSRYDREEIVRLKAKAEYQKSDEFEGEPDPDLDSDAIFVLNKESLFERVNESDFIVAKSLAFYNNNQYPEIEILQKKLAPTHTPTIDCGSQTPDEIVEVIKCKIGEPGRVPTPLPEKLEDSDNYPDLLSRNIEEDGQPFRRWSLFREIDPVLLATQKIVKVGKPEFACGYAGRAFVFVSEENQNLFMRNPKPYQVQKPELSSNYNISIIGMSKSGKTTFAKQLADIYPLKVLEMDDYLNQVILKQAQMEEHISSNPATGMIHLTKNQFIDFQRGQEFTTKELLPILQHENGIELYKRPPPPKEEGEEELDPEEVAKRLREEELKKKKNKKKKDEDTGNPDQPPPPEDIPLNELVPKPDENGKLPEMRGYIFIDFPCNEDQILCMKELNIPLDRVIILKDGEEDEPGAAVKKRTGFFDGALIENEVAHLEKAIPILTENYDDEILKTINMTTEEETFIALRQAIDPFFIRDDDAFARPWERDNLDAEPVLLGEYGAYCPVAFKDDGWLITGLEEFELHVRGKRYTFYNEENMAKFKANLPKYLDIPLIYGLNPNDAYKYVKMPDTRVFFMGSTGSGTKTQIKLLKDDLRLPVQDQKADFQEIINREKEDRKEDRRLKKGFKPPEFDDEGNELPDDDLLVEDEEFEQEKNEIQAIQRILTKFMQSTIIDAKGFLNDEEEGTVVTSFLDLVKNSGRLPEVIVFVTCGEKQMLARKLDEASIKSKYDEEMKEYQEKRRVAIENKRAELEKERDAKIAEGEEGVDPEEPIEVNEDEATAEIEEPKPLEERQATAKEELVNTRNAQIDKIAELSEQLKELKVFY